MAALSLLLLVPILLGCLRVLRGPSMADRLLGIQLTGTTIIGLILVLAQWQQEPALRDVAIVLALLAAALVAFLVQRLRNVTHE